MKYFQKMRKKLLHFVERCDIIHMKINLNDIIYMSEVKQMEILRVKVKGIRNITEAKISFDKITALVGVNGYGKSNIMDAVDFGIDFIKFPSAVKNKLMTSKRDLPILKSNAGRDFEFEIEIKLKSNNVDYYVLYGYSFRWGKAEETAKIISEYLEMKTDEKGQKYKTYLSRSINGAKYKRSETGRCDVNIKIEDDALVINKLTAYDDLYYLDILNQINRLQFYIERHLDPSYSYMPDPFVVKGFGELELGGIQSIPRAIFFLKKEHPDKFELLINSFKQLFPRIVDVQVDEIKLEQSQNININISEDAPIMYTDSIYAMSVIDQVLLQPLRFESLSDGAKRIFLMLTYAVIADVKGLSMIAIEEPENSIHPNLLQNYLDILSQLVSDCKIIFTSHSPYIIQYINPRSIYIGITCADGSVDFRKIAGSKVNSLLKDASQYDRSVGDYIFNILSTADADEALQEYTESNE